MNQKTLAESIKSLIKNGILNEEFTSTDILKLRKTELLKRFEQSSLQTYAANASISHPDAGDLGIGIPVSRGLQTPYFWALIMLALASPSQPRSRGEMGEARGHSQCLFWTIRLSSGWFKSKTSNLINQDKTSHSSSASKENGPIW